MENPELASVFANILRDPAALAQYSRDNLEAALNTLPSAPVSPARVDFDAISVKVSINGKCFDVAVPNEMFDRTRSEQETIAASIGGGIGTREQNRAVVNYLLDREAFDLLAREKAETMNNEQIQLLTLHRENWKENQGAETRANRAGKITDTEAALLKVYRDCWVRDTAGGLRVTGVRFANFSNNRFFDVLFHPHLGALVVRPSAESN